MTTNSPTSLLDFIRRRVGVGELVRRRVDWLPIQAPYSQADVVVFRQNARQHCVEMSVCLIYHNMKGNPSDLKQLIHIGNQLYGILSQLARQLYLQLTELPTMLTVSG